MATKQPVVIPELDAAILKLLPDEGSKVGFKPSARQVKAITNDLRDQDPSLTSAAVGGRMGTLHTLGYAVKVVVQPVGGGAGWQCTREGRDFVGRVEQGASA